MQERIRTKAKKKQTTTVEIDATLAASASAQGIDLASFIEQALRARLDRKAGGGLTDVERKNLERAERYVAEHGPWWDHSEKD